MVAGEYCIYKDKDVKDTVEQIKETLSSIGMEVSEYYDIELPYSVRLSMFNFDGFGTNGKGTNINNALASGYAEFMERLQNGRLLKGIFSISNEDFEFCPDEKQIKDSDLNFLSEFYSETEINIIKKILLMDNGSKAAPFYNVTKNKIEYLPVNFISYRQNCNGMSAGNTPQEALVQGFSEIIERYSLKQILLKGIIMPDIPKEYLQRYTNVKNMVNHIEQNGFKIIFKDASLGKKLPVACTIFINEKKNVYTFKLGTHPSLPVAFERTLSEFAQGNNFTEEIPNESILNFDGDINSDYYRHFIHAHFETGLYYSKVDNCPVFKQLLDNKSEYLFDTSSWIDETRSYTNIQLLEFILNRIRNISDNDIYIRDVSFLNFPSYQIYIPKVSEVYDYDFDLMDGYFNAILWLGYTHDFCEEHNSIESLIKASEYCIKYPYRINKLSIFPNEYILLLCYIAVLDAENVIKYSNILINDTDFIKNKKMISLLKEYYKILSEYKTEEERNSQINKKISPEDLRSCLTFIKNTNFEQIKKYIKQYNEIILKNEKTGSLPEELKVKVQNVVDNIIMQYKNNVPNQNSLAEIFNKIKTEHC